MLAMARRGKNSIKPLWIVIALALLVVAFVGSRLFLSVTGDPYRTVPELDVKSYLENANSLRGNVYKIEGEIANSLAWSRSTGRLFSVTVEGGDDVLPILVTKDFDDINIQKGQKFLFLLEVDDRGILRTKKLVKA